MATVAEIEQQIAALRARLGSLEDAKITVQAEI
jgi:prefoldin subunit 5